MKTKLLFLLTLVVLCPFLAFSQNDSKDGVEIISLKANIRGTPEAQGVVVVTAVKGETFELLLNKGGWYLIQTPRYVGWIHGSTIKLIDLAEVESEPPPMPTTPRRTTKAATANSPFQSEYTGSTEPPDVVIINESAYNLTLNLGGVKYFIKANTQRSVTLDGGNYEYDASAPGVRGLSGVTKFEIGHRYSWTFYVRTVVR